MNKVIVFAGTTEGREICSFLKKYEIASLAHRRGQGVLRPVIAKHGPFHSLTPSPADAVPAGSHWDS